MSPVSVNDDIAIAAAISDVWLRMTDISSWGRWTRVIRHAAVYGALKPGTEFKFNTGKWDFAGVIADIEPERSVSVKLRTIGMTLDSSWTIETAGTDLKVRAAVTASGWIPMFFRSRTKRNLQDNLFTWLYALKVTSERRQQKLEDTRQAELRRPPRKPFSLPGLNIFFKGRRRSEE